jgi:hypothetical protein
MSAGRYTYRDLLEVYAFHASSYAEFAVRVHRHQLGLPEDTDAFEDDEF